MMNLHPEFDRTLAGWLADERPATAPSGLLEQVLDRVAATRRRPGSLILDRWTWRASFVRLATAGRAVALAALIALLILATVVALLLIGSPRPVPPFGPARPGFIAVDTPEGVVLALGDGSQRHVLVPAADGVVINPTWSRDGLFLAFWHRAGASGPWDLEVVRADGTGRLQLAMGVTLRSREATIQQPSNLSWSPDSRRIAFAGDVDGGSAIFVVDREAFGATQIVPERLRAIDPAWSPDGSVIAFQSEVDSTLHVVAPDGTAERQLTWLTGTELWPEWSPDAAAIVTTAWVNGNYDIFTISANGQIVTNISNDPDSDEYSPTWSNDASRIAWGRATHREPSNDPAAFIVVAKADGSDQRVLPDLANLAPSIWSPDDSRLYNYAVGPDGVFQYLLVFDPAGVAPVIRIPVEGNLGNGNWQRLP